AARLLAAAHPLRFAHPMLRAAVYGDMGLARRGALHRRAAELLDERAPDRAALHLLATHPPGEPWVLARLRAPAGPAPARGRPPRGPGARRGRAGPGPPADPEPLLALGRAERNAGVPTAPQRPDQARRRAAEPQLRGQILRELAPLRWATGRPDPLLESEI